ncbi:MAG: hypothetical protein ACI86M_002967 [Saprospiraceae bacterium]|jgi:hypothetical protein
MSPNTESEGTNGNLFMMASRIVFCSYMLLFLGCGSSKKIDVNKDRFIKEENKIHAIKIKGDSLISFTCNSEQINIKFNKINRAYFPEHLKHCLVEEGFKGNIEANKQIAFIIRSKGVGGMVNVWPFNDKYRGPDIFEALLDVGDDWTYTGNPNVGIISGTRSSGAISWCLKMIESIGGSPPTDFSYYVNITNGLDSLIEIKPMEFPHIDIERDKMNYNTLKNAWEAGKIILKKYGQE